MNLQNPGLAATFFSAADVPVLWLSFSFDRDCDYLHSGGARSRWMAARMRKLAATGEHQLDILRTEMSIEHRLTPPKSPQISSTVERLNGRFKEVLQGHHFRSGE